MIPKIDWHNEAEVKQTIVKAKKQIASLMKRDLKQVWQEINSALEDKIKALKDKQASSNAIPQINVEDIIAGKVDPNLVKDFKESGALIVRNVIPKETIHKLYLEFKHYLKDNDYENQDIDPNLDTYFSSLKNKKPQIFNIFWSKCQVGVRQHENMALVKKFLNSFWIYERGEEKYFEYDKDCTYSDRIRIRRPGDDTLGLSPHIDGGSVERWLDDSNLKIYHKIFTGDWQDYLPFDGAYRNTVENIPSPAVCRAFRTYQGWIALTQQGPGDGTLKLIPMLKEATAYTMLRPFLDDVPEDVLCGAVPCKAQSIDPKWHGDLLKGIVSIPTVNPGDTVWWHADLIHAVEDEHKGKEESSVTYVGASPLCQRNKDFLELQKPAFLAGKSSPDFAAENREVSYSNRAVLEDLSLLGQKQMGFMPWNT